MVICSSSFQAWRWARVASFWLWFFFICPQVPTMADSTTNAQQPPETKPLSVLVWPSDFLTLYLKVEALQKNSALLIEQVTTLRSQLDDSETIQQTLSQSLADSSTRLESLGRASEAKAALDQKAVDQARGERMMWAGAGVLVGSAGVALLAFVFHR